LQRRGVQDRGELCLAEEVERLRQLGLSDEEVASRLGVDVSWVETLVSPGEEEAAGHGA
jgi:predicted transposase YdaD